MQDALDSVREFHTKMNAPFSSNPTLLPSDRTAAAALAEKVSVLATETMVVAPEGDVLLRRASMALEELAEWLAAHAQSDLVAAADAWADRAYVLFGDAIAAGLPVVLIFQEVHRSNMTKEPDPLRTGKVIKGAAYEPPRISKLQTFDP
ncbi:hypothetical protein [Symmachiella dynata]|uniref:hypothetical protein n=1 Tax=Symmachiella dynata TaxID=2527995 RepID=UPI0030EE329A